MSKTTKDSIGDRMKGYENVPRLYLTRRTPLIIRLDGKAFHTLTKGLEKPWDKLFTRTMLTTMRELCEEIDNVKMAYWQSDEISLLLTDYDRLETQAWFNRNLQKMVSVSASVATYAFNQWSTIDKGGYFDSRAFTIPKEEVCNYFLWRQQDATRNSVQGLGQANFSHKSLHGLNNSQVQDKLMLEKGINWNDTLTINKRGACCIREDGKWIIDQEIPIFTQDREYIETHI